MTTTANMVLLDTLPIGHTILLTADVADPVTLDVLFHAPVMLSVESIEAIKAHTIDYVCGIEFQPAFDYTN
tara:strand:+ start:1223 stop:1435 length:213 start_codon:yes stop_codon:yes gene_type:complete